MPPREGRNKVGNRERLEHMLGAATEATSFVAGRAEGDLTLDAMLRRAVKDRVQEIGEAAARVSDQGRARSPDLPWSKMVGMRHILVHAYFDLDLEAVWKVVTQDLPVPVRALQAALDSWGDDRA
ncbi:MAG: DUF86 domain-containing protein [Phycisphaerae bacterium]|nr:DUF86 domain-containing protein [Phycisphaerae bacterium]